MLLSLNVAMAAGPAEGTDRIELQRAAHFQGAKNVLVPVFCECQQPAKPGDGEGGIVVRAMPAAVVEGRKTRHDQQLREQQAQLPEGPPPSPARDAGTPPAPHPS